MAVRLEDIARRAGVSKATVSLALNGSTLVKDETKAAIIRIANELNYIPNQSARNLVRKKTGTIGVIVPDIESEYYGSLVSQINNAVCAIGYSMLLAISANDSYQEEIAIRTFISNNVEGVIAIPINKKSSSLEAFRLLKSNRIPCVFSSSYYPDIKCRCVMVDLGLGSYYMTRYLLSSGRTNIRFFCGSREIVPTFTRIEGIKRAFSEKNLPFRDENIIVFNEINYNSVYNYVSSNLKSVCSADALMCVNDMMALGAINALSGSGIDVPGRISVVGYDNVAYSTVSAIPITTINQNLELVARETVSLLKREIDGETISKDQNCIYIPPELIVRASS